MSYPRQNSVADRLQTEAMDVLRALVDGRWRLIEKDWHLTRKHLRRHILDTYHQFFGGERWSLATLKASGAWWTLSDGLRASNARFRDASRLAAKEGINEVYRESILRHAWVLDQTTPPSMKVRIPHKLRLLESAGQVAFYRGPEAVSKFNERWNAWSDGYHAALMNNLQMGAINESSPTDAADEVDATRVSTPAYGLMDGLQRLYAFETDDAMNRGITTVGEVNEGMDVEEIWETRRNLSVCEVCDDNEGKTAEEVDEDMPAHPNCRCYWRIVPKAWAELLRSGNEDDYRLAVEMDARGIVPNAMVIRDAEGLVAGHTTVDFSGWMKDNFYAVSGQ